MKKLLTLMLTGLLVVSVCSCSYAPGDAMNDAPYDGGGDYLLDATPITGAENSESYTEIVENPFVLTSEENNSYFSIDANTASYPKLRSLIQNGYEIPKDAVRVEEMLNYFNYDYATPTDGNIFSLTSALFPNPYNSETLFLTIGLAAQEVEFTEIKNNLVFLIDTSGSMFGDDRLGLVQAAFMMLAENLNPEDRVSIVTYAGSDTVALRGAYGYEKQRIMAVIEDLEAGGSTAGSAGITTAYEIAQQYFIEGGNNRVILATDGDFNVGISNTDALEDFISEKRETGVYFSVFGVGYGNLQSEKMEALALNGNGTYSYIDSVKEAKRALVEEIGGSMITVAKDVKAGITFNTEYVESYRLIGYENKLLTEEEFNDENTDAGEIGSGHTVTVVYEITLTELAKAQSGNVAQVAIKYKPTENVSDDQTKQAEQELLLDIKPSDYHEEMTDTDAFVSSVIEFALLLRNSEYKKDANFETLIVRLDGLDLQDDAFKQEFRQLVKDYQAAQEEK